MSHAPAARLSLDYFDFGRIISLDFFKSADKHLPQNRPLTGLQLVAPRAGSATEWQAVGGTKIVVKYTASLI